MELNEKHIYLIEMLADVADNRTQDEKCVEAGFTPKYVYKLKKDPEFCAALGDATTVSVQANRHRVYRNLLRSSDNGSDTASQIYLKGAGDIVGGTQVNTVVKTGGDNRTFDERLRDNREERETAYNRERAIQKDRE